jgi:hypothetical protein
MAIGHVKRFTLRDITGMAYIFAIEVLVCSIIRVVLNDSYRILFSIQLLLYYLLG